MSEWQLNKIGLLDFWYYDEQEFDFLDGRMLLRGANGSGKSVTMQSFIPLLLDGNMRPERLDPFGSRARKMENYLLEEDDGREERTGYLYMELKKQESDNYLSIGIGIRARRNKKLDTWFFYITDGRRIGKDLYLYKDVQSRLTLTKQELKHRIGAGGCVLETQGEYAQSVNRLLFGFETMEEYQEMIELLIQLRTPKLSKDFKPTVINEILSKSLQTLSEDDLRPMSEAIENMDNLKTNLDALQESVRAAEQIERAYGNYNAVVLYDKAQRFCESTASCRKLALEREELSERRQEGGRRLQEESARYEALKREERVLGQERDSLRDSDAAKLKQQELVLEKELEEAGREVLEKEGQEENKKERQLELAARHRQQQDDNDRMKEKLCETLDEMEEAAGGTGFDEFSFMRTELCGQMEQPYEFAIHSKRLEEHTKKLETARDMLQRAGIAQERYDQKLQEVDECRLMQEQAERECRQYEKLLQETREEAVERFFLWEKHNEQLHLPGQVQQQIAQRLERYTYGEDYAEIRGLGRETYAQRERELEQLCYEKERACAGLRAEYGQIEAELAEWRNKKDPEPECSEAVSRNRELLRKKGIPYLQFYKVIDFGAQLGEERAAYVEEALYSMGILDALIVPAEYRQKVRALDTGVCDRYIFSDVAHVKQSLIDLLDVDNAENDILKYQNVSNILSAIGACEDDQQAGGTWVDAMGNYRIGVLEGTITRDYRARYIGVRARERFRAEKIEQLEQSAHALQEQITECESEIEQLEQSLAVLNAEWGAFPSDADLKTAAKDYADQCDELDRRNRQLEGLRGELAQRKKELDSLQRKARELCAKCYLTARLDVFAQALSALGDYRTLLTELRLMHGSYLNGIGQMQSIADGMEEVDADLDDIRYELGRAKRRQKEKEASLESVREQLKLTDYEQIRDRLDACMKRLASLPGEREDAARQITHWEDSIAQMERDAHRQEEDYQRERNRASLLQRVFEAEYRLGYVEKDFVINDDMEDQAGKVCEMLAGRCSGRRQTDLLGSLQESYHQNRGYLADYQLTMQSLFGDEQENAGMEESAGRIDLAAKYRGVSVRFLELLGKLREDEEELRRLLDDRDRELFEDILANTISKKIRAKIQASSRWVAKMNQLMDTMHTSSGLKLSLNWKKKRAEKEEQLDTKELVELLSKDVEIMRQEEVDKMSLHFRSKIAEARKLSEDTSSVLSFHAVIREVLDYRKWFEFTLECQKTGEKKKELTDRVFFTFSGGEKAMAMYVPLFSAVVAKYAGAREDALRLISLDEAFAGVDETNIRDMFRLMVGCRFNFMINSQVLWGDYDTVPGLAIYYLQRPENAKFVAVTSYVWNGRERILAEGADREKVYGG